MEIRTKKLLTNVGFGVWFLVIGMDYAVILPTAWLYVKSLGGNEFFYSLVTSSFSAASLFSSVFWGFWLDRLQKIKGITICAALCAITGGVLYTVGTTKYFLLGGRALGGIGNGLGSVIFAHLSKTTATQERTKMFSYFFAVSTFGFLIGPGFQFLLRMCNFYIGPVKIDEYSSPGVFIAALLSILLIYMVFFLHDIPYADDDNNVGETERQGRVTQASETPTLKTTLRVLFTEETVVLLSVALLSGFKGAGLETISPPLLEMMFRWGDLELSIYFICCGLWILVGYVCLGCISKKLQDRTVVLAGVVVLCLSLLWQMGVFTNTYSPGRLPYFLIGSALRLASAVLLQGATTSLFSKLTDESIQGRIIGPLWTGSTLYMLKLMVGVILALTGLVLIMVLLSFRRLKDPKWPDESRVTAHVSFKADPDETTLLLSNSDA